MSYAADQHRLLYERDDLMTALRQYIIAVTAAAMICGIIKSTSKENNASATILRLIAGIFMTVTVLSPVVRLDLRGLPDLGEDFMEQAMAAVALGEEVTADEINTIITEQTQAYILDKAESFGARLEVEVQIARDGTYRPKAVTLRGSVSPYAKSRLQQIIEEDLQISKEDQQWIG